MAFDSDASNLVPGDTNGTSDVFVKDLQTGAITRVSTDAAAQGNSYSFIRASRPTGAMWRSIAMPPTSCRRHQRHLDVFVRDLQTGAITRVSTDANGDQGNGDSYDPSISADGRYVAFISYASNLVPGDTNGTYDVFVQGPADRRHHPRLDRREWQPGERLQHPAEHFGRRALCGVPKLCHQPRARRHQRHLRRVRAGTCRPAPSRASPSTRTATRETTASTSLRAFRPTGATWRSQLASNLVPGDTNGTYDVFVKDLQTGAITRVSTDANGGQGNANSYTPSISADGRYVAFTSYASNLVPGDTNGTSDVFVRDLQTGAITRVSTDADGDQGNSTAGGISISADGRYVAFNSDASNLVPDDTNGAYDVFVANE